VRSKWAVVSVCPFTVTSGFGGNGALVLAVVALGAVTGGGDGFGIARLDETGWPGAFRLAVWAKEVMAKRSSTNARRMLVNLIE